MEKEQRLKQSQIAIKERDLRRVDNIAHATAKVGKTWYINGVPRLPIAKTIFKWSHRVLK